MKQTAVEWLYNNLKSHFEHNGDLLEVIQFSFEQAKEMEKQQIIDARDNGFKESGEGWNGDFEITIEQINSVQYYNEIFNK
jgi:hypothetical protein